MFEFLIKKSYKISNWLWLLLGIIILTICILYITLYKKPSYTNGNGTTSTTNDKIKSGNETSGTTTTPTTKVTTAPTTTPTLCSDIRSYCNSLDKTYPLTCNYVTSEDSPWDLPQNHNLKCPARCFCAMYNGSRDDNAGGRIGTSNLICGSDYTGYSDAGCYLQPVTAPTKVPTTAPITCNDFKSYCNSLDATNSNKCNRTVEYDPWDNPKNHNLNCPARCFCAIYNMSPDDIAGGKIYASNTSCQTNYTGYSAAGCT